MKSNVNKNSIKECVKLREHAAALQVVKTNIFVVCYYLRIIFLLSDLQEMH